MALPPWLAPLVAGLVSLTFATLVALQYRERKRPHQLAWALGLGAYALASYAEAYVAVAGWTIPLYRVYFPLASALVGLLGAGTLYLLRERRVGNAFAAFVALAFLTAAIGQFTIPLEPGTPVTIEDETRPLEAWGSHLGSKAIPFPHPARLAFLALNVVGGLALIAGALASWRQTRARGVLLIGLGAIFPFTGGTLSTLGVPDARILAQVLGILVMFTGYLLSREGAPAASRHVPERAHAETGRSP